MDRGKPNFKNKGINILAAMGKAKYCTMEKGLQIIRKYLSFHWMCIAIQTVNCSSIAVCYSANVWVRSIVMFILFVDIGRHFGGVLDLCERRDAIRRWMPIHNLIHPEQ